MRFRLINEGGRVCSWLAAVSLLWLGVDGGFAAGTGVTVTVTQQAPLESVSPAGDVLGVKEATPGGRYTLVSTTAGQVTMQDATGLYRISIQATDYVPLPSGKPSPSAITNSTAAPSPPASAVAVTPPASPVPPPLVSAGTPSSGVATDGPSASGDDALSGTAVPQDKVDATNAGLGKKLFGKGSIWKESALVIAQRLNLGLEGRTKWETSYRRYFSGDPSDPDAALLGTGVSCIALYADADDHPTSLLIALTNDGDYKKVSYLLSDIYRIDHPVTNGYRFYPDKSRDQLQKEYDDDLASFEPVRKAEEETLGKSLSSLFGDPKFATFGNEAATREDIRRWDWSDVSFLLTCQENKYNLLRIVPTDVADNNGRTERIPRDEVGAKLSGAVEHRPNGDVVITQIPMANQGPKGYCVPATWERVLRYEGVPGDMYTLSRIGNTRFGGGTNDGNIAVQLDDTLHDYGRHTESLDLDIIDAVSLHRYIDNGIPIFWSVNPLGYKPVEERYALADRDKEWDRWKTLLSQAQSDEAKPLPPLGDDSGHEVLIIGYNADTKEIAWTDPWGHDTSERWMTMAEAQRCSRGGFYTISW